MFASEEITQGQREKSLEALEEAVPVVLHVSLGIVSTHWIDLENYHLLSIVYCTEYSESSKSLVGNGTPDSTLK